MRDHAHRNWQDILRAYVRRGGQEVTVVRISMIVERVHALTGEIVKMSWADSLAPVRRYGLGESVKMVIFFQCILFVHSFVKLFDTKCRRGGTRRQDFGQVSGVKRFQISMNFQMWLTRVFWRIWNGLKMEFCLFTITTILEDLIPFGWILKLYYSHVSAGIVGHNADTSMNPGDQLGARPRKCKFVQFLLATLGYNFNVNVYIAIKQLKSC